ncbi:MAG: DUF2628 domain-containing protein [Alphaproteobacteria bacterium]|jgi:hypothetical protein
MRVYTVHRLAWSADEDGDAVLVKEGFAWPAFIFGIFWTLWHGMWIASAALFAISLLVGVAIGAAGLSDDVASLAQIVLHLGLGIFGNDMRRWSLRRTGRVETAVVAAPRLADAERRYFAALAGGAP